MGSGPLIIGLGGVGAAVAAAAGPGALMIDTDLSTRDRYKDNRVLVLGQALLRGEGAGRNLKMGMIAFRSGMEPIIGEMAGHAPVLIVSGTEGGTGLAGAVEINSVLGRSGIPRFTFLVAGSAHEADASRESIAAALLAGPLHPGAMVRDEGGSVARALRMFARASERSPGIRLTPEAWARIATVKGTFHLEVQDISVAEIGGASIGAGAIPRGITIASVQAPATMASGEIRKAVENVFGGSEIIGVGIVETAEGGRLTIASLSEPRGEAIPPQGGAAPDLTALMDVEDLEPGRPPEMLH